MKIKQLFLFFTLVLVCSSCSRQTKIVYDTKQLSTIPRVAIQQVAPTSTTDGEILRKLEVIKKEVSDIESLLSGTDAPIEELPALPTRNIVFGTQFSTEIDGVINSGAFAKIQSSTYPIRHFRLFWLTEKGLPKNGIIADGGKYPREHTFKTIPNQKGRGQWDGSFFGYNMRMQAIRIGLEGSVKNATARRGYIPPVSLTVSPESILDPFHRYRRFQYKQWALLDYGYTTEQQDAKIQEHMTGFLESSGHLVDYLEIGGNEPWGFFGWEYKRLHDNRMVSYLKYNEGKDPEDYMPRLGTAAYPLGQGEKYNLLPTDLVTEHSHLIDYVNAHLYPFDSDGNLTKDYAGTVGEQLKEIEAFRAKYFPHATIRITETGDVQENALEYYTWLATELLKYPSVDMVHGYSAVPIDNEKFGRMYLFNYNGTPTEAWLFMNRDK